MTKQDPMATAMRRANAQLAKAYLKRRAKLLEQVSDLEQRTREVRAELAELAERMPEEALKLAEQSEKGGA